MTARISPFPSSPTARPGRRSSSGPGRLPPLPAGVTAHKLRHTFASVLTACGEDSAYVMTQLGHADPKFTLRVYTHVMRRSEGERERLRALVGRGAADDSALRARVLNRYAEVRSVGGR